MTAKGLTREHAALRPPWTLADEPRLLDREDHDGAIPLALHRRRARPPEELREHGVWLLDEIEASGLRGRGGAGFPTATKLRAVAGRSPVVVVNATEGEPASGKDRLLLRSHPHLVIDGAVLAAYASGATEVHFGISRRDHVGMEALRTACAQRVAADLGVAVTLHAAPDHFVTGEETALVHWINGGEALPTGRRVRVVTRGVASRPTAVLNAETVAHLARIASHGAAWFRERGTVDEPGTRLVTVTGQDASRRVVEVEIGAPLTSVLTSAESGLGATTSVLVGGYFGTWVKSYDVSGTPYSERGLAAIGANPGCGMVALLPPEVCAWCETARLLHWMASESAGQCGACVNGLPALATAATEIARGLKVKANLGKLRRWSEQIDGRGACSLPDGAVRLLRSALDVHGDLIKSHGDHRRCPLGSPAFLPFPDLRAEPWR